MLSLPQHPSSAAHIFDRMQNARTQDLPWRSGKVWAYVYPPGPELEAIQKRAFCEFLTENMLDPTAFPSLLKFENDVVAMCADHLRGDAQVVGSMTTGGTESCLLAVKTARDFARAERGIAAPEMIVAVTTHAAFFKAAHYFDMKLHAIPVDPVTFKMNPADVAAVMNENTALIVASAPSYAHGVIDPIVEIAALAKARNVLCHVDACIGGFLLPLFRELGAPVAPFDFTVDGVTSISVDLHKYAFCPKGASVLLWRHKGLRKYQYFACSSWAGYALVNPTILSTKSGGPIAAAWATLHAVGREGYLERAQKILQATRIISDGIRNTPGLQLLGVPEMSLIAFTGVDVSAFLIADELNARGWYVQPQLAFAPHRENIHLSLVPASAEHAEAFVQDLAPALEAARARGFGPQVAALGQVAASLQPELMTDESIGAMMAMAGIDPTALPERRADVNALMNALPAEAKEVLLTSFFNEMFRQPAEAPATAASSQ